MADTSAWRILEAAGRSITTLVLANVVGAALVVYPKSREADAGGLLSRVFLGELAKAANSVCLPALLFVELALFVNKLISPPEHLRRPFLVASSMHNTVAVPVILLTTLVVLDPVDREPNAFSRGSAYIFLYALVHTTVTWSILPTFLASPPAPTPVINIIASRDYESSIGSRTDCNAVLFPEAQQFPIEAPAERILSPAKREIGLAISLRLALQSTAQLRIALRGLRNPNIVAAFMGIGVGAIAPLRQAIFSPDGAIGPLGKALEVLSRPYIGLALLVMAGSLGHSLKDRREHALMQSQQEPQHNSLPGEPYPPTARGGAARTSYSALLSRLGATGRWLLSNSGRRVLVEDEEEAVAVDSAATDDGRQRWQPALTEQPEREAGSAITSPRYGIQVSSPQSSGSALSGRQLMVFAFWRMFLTPAVQLSVNIALRDAWLADKEPLLLLIMFMQPITPTQTGLIALLQHIGRGDAAEALAPGLLIQYAFSIVSMTLYITLAIQLAGPSRFGSG